MKRILVSLVLLAACSSASYQKALDTSLAAANGAMKTLQEYSDAEQGRIVAAAKDEPSKVAALTAFKARRAPVLAAFTIAYTALAVAATPNADPSSLTTAAKAIVDCYTAVRVLIGGAP